MTGVPSRKPGPANARQDPVAGEGVGVHGGVRLERGRGGERGVVEDDHDRLARRPARPDTAAACRAGCRRPARARGSCTGRLSSARMRRVGRSTAVSGSQMPVGRRPNRSSKSRRPQRISVAPIGQRGERQDGVVVGLGHGVAAVAVVDAGRHVRVHEPLVRGGVVGRQPARQRGAEVVGDVAQVAPLGVGLVALGVDAGVPVAVRRRGRLRRDLPAERVAALGLIEVAVHGQPGSTHWADGSGVAVAGEAPVGVAASTHDVSPRIAGGRVERADRRPGSRRCPVWPDTFWAYCTIAGPASVGRAPGWTLEPDFGRKRALGPCQRALIRLGAVDPAGEPISVRCSRTTATSAPAPRRQAGSSEVRQPASCAAWSIVCAAAKRTVSVACSPGASETGQRKSSELPW